MENNLPINQPIQTNQGQAVPQPVPTQAMPPIAQQPPSSMPQQTQPANKNHFMRLLLILIAICLIVFLGVYIYFSFFNKQDIDSSSIKIENTISPTTAVSVKKTEEEELNTLDVGDVEVDLKDVDADLQQL